MKFLLSKALYLKKDFKESLKILDDIIQKGYLNYEAYLKRAILRLIMEGSSSENPLIDEDIKRYIEVVKKVAKEDPKFTLFSEISMNDETKKYDKKEVKCLKKIYKRMKNFL